MCCSERVCPVKCAAVSVSCQMCVSECVCPIKCAAVSVCILSNVLQWECVSCQMCCSEFVCPVKCADGSFVNKYSPSVAPHKEKCTEHRESWESRVQCLSETSYQNVTFYQNFTNKPLSSDVTIKLLKLPPHEMNFPKYLAPADWDRRKRDCRWLQKSVAKMSSSGSCVSFDWTVTGYVFRQLLTLKYGLLPHKAQLNIPSCVGISCTGTENYSLC